MHASAVKSAWLSACQNFVLAGVENTSIYFTHSIPSLIPQYGHVNAESMVQLNRKPPLESEV